MAKGNLQVRSIPSVGEFRREFSSDADPDTKLICIKNQHTGGKWLVKDPSHTLVKRKRLFKRDNQCLSFVKTKLNVN